MERNRRSGRTGLFIFMLITIFGTIGCGQGATNSTGPSGSTDAVTIVNDKNK